MQNDVAVLATSKPIFLTQEKPINRIDLIGDAFDEIMGTSNIKETFTNLKL